MGYTRYGKRRVSGVKVITPHRSELRSFIFPSTDLRSGSRWSLAWSFHRRSEPLQKGARNEVPNSGSSFTLRVSTACIGRIIKEIMPKQLEIGVGELTCECQWQVYFRISPAGKSPWTCPSDREMCQAVPNTCPGSLKAKRQSPTRQKRSPSL